MPTRTVRLKLPQDEADILRLWPRRWKVCMSDIVRSALKSVFEHNVPETESIALSSRNFQLLAKENRRLQPKSCSSDADI